MQEITVDELHQKMDNFVIIDVREKSELVHGIIKGAVSIPLNEFINSASQLKQKYGNEDLVIYCRSGGRSAFATQLAEKKGMNARNLIGGVIAWSKIDPNVKAY